MRRYDNVKTRNISRTDTRTRYGTAIYKDTPITQSDIYVLTQSGDRLDLIANQFYGDSTLWWLIAKSNGLTDMNVEAGVKLRLPVSSQASTVRDKSNSTTSEY